jgi:ABC-type molybdate transport system ATPase subunit
MPRSLSGGEAQRVALGRAFSPPALSADGRALSALDEARSGRSWR